MEGVEVINKRKGLNLWGGLMASGGCGVYDSTTKQWYTVSDDNGDGATKDDALGWYNDPHETFTKWCCDSCPWNAS
jgi:hypothetical protein